jgi:predicted HTH transcriptional regulator
VTHPVWEDHLLERKTDRQSKDIRRTAVAFANSVRPGHTAVILIGEENDGKVSGVSNPDDFQMKVRKELDGIYPSIVWKQSLYEKEGKVCIRIEIEYSGDTPHFGDAAWIRRGSESVAASSEQLGILVSLRSGKVRTLSEW